MLAELNLVEMGNGVPYKIIKHPDGQVDVQINVNAVGMEGLPVPETVLIKTRMNSYEDLYKIKAAVNALRSWGVYNVNLFISCFFHQRDDREFAPGISFGLWEMCEDIKALQCRVITIFHPHSDVLPALLKTRLNRVIVLEPKQFIQLAIADIRSKHGIGPGDQDVVLVSPDAGAYKWVYKLGEKLGMKVVTGNKCRIGDDLHVDVHGDVDGRVCLILDDYLDGGRTFTELTGELIKQKARTVYQYVSHGLFSYGEDGLKDYMKHVYTTNSIKNDTSDFVTRFKVI